MKSARDNYTPSLGAPSGPQLISSRDTRYLNEIQNRNKSKGANRVPN